MRKEEVMSANAIMPHQQAGGVAATSNRIAQDGASVNTPQGLEQRAADVRRVQKATIVQQVNGADSATPAVDEESLHAEVAVLSKLAEIMNRALNFEVHMDTQEVYVQVVDRDTGEVVRQIPSEELVRLSERIRDAVGLLFDGEG